MSDASRRFAPSLKVVFSKTLVPYLEGRKVFPTHFEVSPTGFCQARCPWCFYRNKTTARVEMDFDAVSKFMREFSENGGRAITWTGGGEPTIHSRFSDISTEAKRLGFRQGLITNGLVVRYDPSVFDWVRISKTDMPWPTDNILTIRAACEAVGISVNYSVDDEMVENALSVGRMTSVDYVQVRPALPIGGMTADIKAPALSDELLVISQYKFDECGKRPKYSKCRGYHFAPFLWEDGTVSACGYMRGNSVYDLGNIYSDSLFDIFDRCPDNLPVDELCQTCCRNHELNITLDVLCNVKNPEFI